MIDIFNQTDLNLTYMTIYKKETIEKKDISFKDLYHSKFDFKSFSPIHIEKPLPHLDFF